MGADRVALVLQHDPHVHLGLLGDVLEESGFEVRVIDVTDVDPASVAQPDLVVVLGGTMGAYETEQHPYLVREIAYLADRLGREQPTLGICLGSQLMATALGERARKGSTTEIGFRTVTPTDAGLDSPLRHFADVPVMQWHGDTFGLPADATRLASSSEYTNEAFSVGDFGLAVQFHPELIGEMYELWISTGTDELASVGVDADELRADAAAKGPAMEAAARAMFAEWLALQR